MRAGELSVDIEIKIGHDAVKFHQRTLCRLFSVQREALGIGGDHLGIVMAEAVVGKRFDLMRQMDRLHAVGATALDTLVREAFTEVPVQIPANFAFHNSYLPFLLSITAAKWIEFLAATQLCLAV